MKIIKIVNEKFGQNNYLCVDNDNAILIDASASVSQIQENLKIFDKAPVLRAIFLTHEHFDHISELDNLVVKFKVPVYISKNGKVNLYDENKNLSIMSSPFKIKEKKLVKTFKDGEEFEINGINVKCYQTPGHSMGSSIFIVDNEMFTGDTIFRVDTGRFDLYGGDENVLNISLKRILQELSLNCEHYYPGHGANFNREEMEYNVKNHLGEN